MFLLINKNKLENQNENKQSLIKRALTASIALLASHAHSKVKILFTQYERL